MFPVPLSPFRPRLLTAVRGYDRHRFQHDLGAGLTVAIVALPLAMAFAIASGLKPEAGLWTADFFQQVQAIATHLHGINPYAFGLGTVCVLGLWLCPRVWTRGSPLQPALELPVVRRAAVVGARLPGPIVALVSLTLLAWALSWPVETLGTRFGGIPRNLPAFALPAFSWETVKQLVIPTITIALLGAIESLLCARVADQVSRLPRHDPNQELMAQGMANLVTPFFGGMPVTGTIARTVTNVRAGASTPLAGVIHALGVLVVVLVAAPLALHVPLAVLAGILLFTAWNMGEWREFARLRQHSPHFRLIMMSTFLLTVVFDLTVALQVGLVAACGLYIRSMSAQFQVEEVPNDAGQLRFRLYGSLFFGAVTQIDRTVQAVEAVPGTPHVVLDALQLVYLDTSGVESLRQLHEVVLLRGGTLRIENLQPQPRERVERSGFARELQAHLQPESASV